MKRIIKILSIFLISFFTYTFAFSHDYSIDKAVEYLNQHAEVKSRNMCALYVERAIRAGGQPAFILPAWGYAHVLPNMGFKEISRNNYIPKKGDIVVFPRVKGHIFGHIAMYNGEQWISDFKQKNIIVAKAYYNCNYRLFRHE